LRTTGRARSGIGPGRIAEEGMCKLLQHLVACNCHERVEVVVQPGTCHHSSRCWCYVGARTSGTTCRGYWNGGYRDVWKHYYGYLDSCCRSEDVPWAEVSQLKTPGVPPIPAPNPWYCDGPNLKNPVSGRPTLFFTVEGSMGKKEM